MYISASWAVILKTESENERLSSLSGESAGLRFGREHNGAESTSTDPIVTAANMDPAHPAMIKQVDYVVGQYSFYFRPLVFINS